MKWVQSGADLSVSIPFLVEGEFVTPDTGSITLTFRGADGTVISGLLNFPLPTVASGTVQLISTVPGDTSFSNMALQIPAALNQVATGDFESRYVIIRYRAQGSTQEFKTAYNLHPFLPIQATEEDVRSWVGAKYQELPDSEIDLVSNFFSLKSSLGNNFTDALNASGLASISANKVLSLTTALKLLPGLPAKLTKLETSSNASIQRNRIDFEALRSDLEAELAQALNEMISALLGSSGTASRTLFSVSSTVSLFPG